MYPRSRCEAARRPAVGARNQTRWLPADRPSRRRDGAALDAKGHQLHRADSFTIDGEAVVAGPDGVAQFDELRRRQSAGAAFLYAFDLLEHDGEDLRNRPLLDRKAALARLLKRTKTGIVFNEHVAVEGAIVFDHACKLGAEGTVSKRITAPYRSGSCTAWIKVKNPAAIAVQRERSENWNR